MDSFFRAHPWLDIPDCFAITLRGIVDCMKQVALRLSDELAAAIDQERFQTPRERWIRERLMEAVGLGVEPVDLSASIDALQPAVPPDPGRRQVYADESERELTYAERLRARGI